MNDQLSESFSDAVGRSDMRWIKGGVFKMGAQLFYPEEAPVNTVAVSDFWMDEYEVTAAEFAAFVAATGYITVAERPLDPTHYPGADPNLLKPGAAVFQLSHGRVDMNNICSRWVYMPGANWRHPEGPGSTIEGCLQEPVAQVVFEDARLRRMGGEGSAN